MNTAEAIKITQEVIARLNKINILGKKENEAMEYLMTATQQKSTCDSPRCSQKIKSCRFYKNGICDILNNTYFDRACPFYKERK